MMPIRYTTAPECYDGFSTRTLIPAAGEDRGLRVRKVHVWQESLMWQSDRYASGLHCCYGPEGWAELASRGIVKSFETERECHADDGVADGHGQGDVG